MAIGYFDVVVGVLCMHVIGDASPSKVAMITSFICLGERSHNKNLLLGPGC